MMHRESGFTIIETSLVLAVTGLVIAGVLLGIGNGLSHQRYTDAVNQTVDFFRGQYAQTTNTLNNRSAAERCDASGISDTGTAMPIGASECLLVGKIVRATGNDDVTVSQVLALHDPTDDDDISTLSDVEILRASHLQQGNQLDDFRPDWGARLVTPGSTDTAQFTMMVVRTPVTGTIQTFTSASNTSSIADLLNAPQEARSICIDQTGFFGVGVAPMGVRITKGAANTTGVEIIPSGECV